MSKTNRRQHNEGSVYYQKNPGRWVAAVHLGWVAGQRDRRYFYGQTPEEAIENRDLFLDRRRDGFTLPKGRPPTLGEWAGHWLYHIARAKVQDTTWHKDYRAKVEMHIIPYFDHTKLTNDEVNEELLERWLAWLQGKNLSASTITGVHRLLSQILKTAVIRGRLMRNPASNVHPPAIKQAEPMPPEADEIHAILFECEERRSGPRWITGLATGTRQGETLGLLWPHVDVDDVDEASINIRWELARLPWQHGCQDPHACGARLHRYPCPPKCPKAARTAGRRHTCITVADGKLCPLDCTSHARSCPQRWGGGLILKEPKSERSVRTVAVGRAGAMALRRQRQLQLEERMAAGPDWTGWAHHCDRQPRRRDVVCPDCRLPFRPDALVFTQPNGRPADPRADWDDWDDLLRTCELDHYRIHDGRHHAATALLEGGVDVRVVQDLLGHATPDFTRRAYQHVRPKLQRKAANILDQALGGNRR